MENLQKMVLIFFFFSHTLLASIIYKIAWMKIYFRKDARV